MQTLDGRPATTGGACPRPPTGERPPTRRRGRGRRSRAGSSASSADHDDPPAVGPLAVAPPPADELRALASWGLFAWHLDEWSRSECARWVGAVAGLPHLCEAFRVNVDGRRLRALSAAHLCAMGITALADHQGVLRAAARLRAAAERPDARAQAAGAAAEICRQREERARRQRPPFPKARTVVVRPVGPPWTVPPSMPPGAPGAPGEPEEVEPEEEVEPDRFAWMSPVRLAPRRRPAARLLHQCPFRERRCGPRSTLDLLAEDLRDSARVYSVLRADGPARFPPSAVGAGGDAYVSADFNGVAEQARQSGVAYAAAFSSTVPRF